MYIENGKLIRPLDTIQGSGNFYLKPNGVFYMTGDNLAVVCFTPDFKSNRQENTPPSRVYAFDRWQIHPAFKPESTSLNIRNGVGILPDKRVLLVQARNEINLLTLPPTLNPAGIKMRYTWTGWFHAPTFPKRSGYS
ncbi:MAG: hypothetical protein V4594_04485 [Bacteroidota bacterium]